MCIYMSHMYSWSVTIKVVIFFPPFLLCSLYLHCVILDHIFFYAFFLLPISNFTFNLMYLFYPSHHFLFCFTISATSFFCLIFCYSLSSGLHFCLCLTSPSISPPSPLDCHLIACLPTWASAGKTSALTLKIPTWNASPWRSRRRSEWPCPNSADAT